MPPTESELATAMTTPDPDAIHAARVALDPRRGARARPARSRALYGKLRRAGRRSAPTRHRRAGARCATRCCAFSPRPTTRRRPKLADAHYRARHQHDRHDRGACRADPHGLAARGEAAFADFHDRFRDDPLVLDKWMSLQAGSPACPTPSTRVRALMSDPAFDIKNPNRVRALIGAFSGNHLRFHARDGGGLCAGRRGGAHASTRSIPRSPRAWRARSRPGGATIRRARR